MAKQRADQETAIAVGERILDELLDTGWIPYGDKQRARNVGLPKILGNAALAAYGKELNKQGLIIASKAALEASDEK